MILYSIWTASGAGFFFLCTFNSGANCLSRAVFGLKYFINFKWILIYIETVILIPSSLVIVIRRLQFWLTNYYFSDAPFLILLRIFFAVF